MTVYQELLLCHERGMGTGSCMLADVHEKMAGARLQPEGDVVDDGRVGVGVVVSQHHEAVARCQLDRPNVAVKHLQSLPCYYKTRWLCGLRPGESAAVAVASGSVWKQHLRRVCPV